MNTDVANELSIIIDKKMKKCWSEMLQQKTERADGHSIW